MLNKMESLKADSKLESYASSPKRVSSRVGVLPQKLFLRELCQERRRTERSGRRFVLLLVESDNLLKHGKASAQTEIAQAILQCTRDTDQVGWYAEGKVLGVIFTEIGNAEESIVLDALSTKVTNSLSRVVGLKENNSEVNLSFHVFPEDWDEGREGPTKSTLQMIFGRDPVRKRISLSLKRIIDVIGTSIGLVLALPLFVAIAIVIKVTSPGPIFYRQVRLGRYGKRFTFLKFRSMHANNDPKIHQEYMSRFIKGAAGTEHNSGDQGNIYKLTADPRITVIGRFLRNTSLDELPQFLNVLKGDMSLVGPRPPVTYEFERYDLWHKQRLLTVKPGITGLWQVYGRSRVKFDDMVRLDIRYARSWSLWLDIKILLQTPSAVLSRSGAC